MESEFRQQAAIMKKKRIDERTKNIVQLSGHNLSNTNNTLGSSVHQINENREEEESEQRDHQNTRNFEEYMSVTNEEPAFNFSLNSKINQKSK